MKTLERRLPGGGMELQDVSDDEYARMLDLARALSAMSMLVSLADTSRLLMGRGMTMEQISRLERHVIEFVVDTMDQPCPIMVGDMTPR